MSESDPLSQLSASIADGDAIDWDAVRALAGDENIRQLIEHLRVVAGVAEVHRSQIAETIAAETAAAVTPPAIAGAHDGPARWGHLALVRKIGEGAYGEVYEAVDTWLDHPRALKLLKREVANRVSAPHILHEARKLVRVRHPNVVMVHGADSHDGRVGFWMDLIEGQTLEQRVREGRLSAGEATYVGKELCRALAAVHHANLVHRDVKAQNVMRATDGGRIILMDFGAGEFQDVPSTVRQGTPLYLAPEVLTGGTATVQSDIYALGVLLYYLVTGRFPVEGSSLTDLVLAHAQGARRHLRDARPDLPDSYITVVERATARDPRQRFQSAGDFYAALEERGTVTGPDLVVPPVPPPVPPPYPQIPLGHVLMAALVTGVAIFVSGLVASRTFEVVLHIGKEYASGPADYFTIGGRALLPVALNWLVAIAIVTLLAGVRLVLGSRGGRVFERWRSLVNGVRPTVLATLIPVAGAVVWLGFSFHYWPIVDTLAAMQLGTRSASHVPRLDISFRNGLIVYSEMAAMLSFFLIFAVWRWWPGFERRSDDVSAVRRAKWACIALAAAVIVAAVAPRRFAMEEFEAVMYKNEPAFVIGTSGDELLLYLPKAADNVRPTVRRGDPDLVPTNQHLWLVRADDIDNSKRSPK